MAGRRGEPVYALLLHCGIWNPSSGGKVQMEPAQGRGAHIIKIFLFSAGKGQNVPAKRQNKLLAKKNDL
jgi:hypothetical protein